MNLWPHIINNIAHSLGDGNNTEFWYHEWEGGGIKLCNEAIDPSSIVNDHRCVKDFICVNGQWDINNLTVLLSNDIINKIRAIVPPSLTDEPDSFIWSKSSNNIFSVKSAY